MSAADDVLWQVADEIGVAPLTFHDMPERARLWLLAWLNSSHEGCSHAEGAVLYALAGERRALCGACAQRAGLDSLAVRCGRCGAATGDDPLALRAIFPVPPHLLAIATLCSGCVGAS